jgi:hypothetical protein
LDDPDVVSHSQRLHEAYEAQKCAEAEVEKLYTRWAELEAKQA